MSEPLVSIVMAVFNEERYVNRAIESCLEQTFTDFELIIVNDGSTDGTLEVLEHYKKHDKRIRIIDNRNKGLAASLNEGIAQANGTWIARMDADDISLPDRLLKQTMFLDKNPGVDILGTAIYLKSINGEDLGISRLPQQHDDLVKNIHLSSPFVHPSVVFRRSKIIEAGGYNDNLKRAQDYELWSRLASSCRFHNLQEPLLIYTYSERLRFSSMISAAKVRIIVGLRAGKPFSAAAKAIMSIIVGTLVAVGVYRRRTARKHYKVNHCDKHKQ